MNYSIGRRIGPRLLGIGDGPAFSHRLINPEHVKRAHEFFELHGGQAVVLARFVPIVRTFLPFVAGAAEMNAGAFLFYNIAGGIGWVTICMGAGYLFGNVPFIKDNFTAVTLGIVFVSVLPIVFEVMKHRKHRDQDAHTNRRS